MTRRFLIAVLLAALAVPGLAPSRLAAAEKGPLEVTYYYLPG